MEIGVCMGRELGFGLGAGGGGGGCGGGGGGEQQSEEEEGDWLWWFRGKDLFQFFIKTDKNLCVGTIRSSLVK